MQTFLPYPGFIASAAILDSKRLGKQRIEALTLIRGYWPNHPVSRMWRGYHEALRQYYNAVVIEWIDRGFRNNLPLFPEEVCFKCPPWLGDERFHSSHRAALLAKNPAHYSRFGWVETPGISYWWPVLRTT